MLRKIVMPTDGSPESEKPRSIATQLARSQDATLTLIRVEDFALPISDGAAGMSHEVYAQLLDDLKADAVRKLAHLAESLQAEGVRVAIILRRGNAEAELLDYVAAERPDLVVMASHGRSGLARFALGSVADRMVREGSAPVLVTRMTTEPSGSLERALVMLDGSGLAEQALPIVTDLAGKPLQHLVLYRAVADPGDRVAAGRYLEAVATRFRAAGMSTEIKIDLGDPRPNVERAAHDVDLVILSTHGRGGLDRLQHGSVAEHVMREVTKPALLVRAQS